MTRRLGQTCSQKPHSMHLSIHGETGGVRLMFLLTTSGSPLISTPGLNRPLGSTSFLILVINEYALSPHSRAHERGHRTAGAVLRLQRAVQLIGDQNHGVHGEGHEAVDLTLLGEVRGQHEVGVAGARMPELDALARVGVTVLDEQRLQAGEQLRELVQGHGHVLEQHRRAGRAGAADDPEQVFAYAPETCMALGRRAEVAHR